MARALSDLRALLKGIALASGGILIAGVACDPCVGTPSCRGAPDVSVTGQFIEYPSGAPVGGVRVEFVRESGVPLSTDPILSTANADGFFALRFSAEREGEVEGSLIVTPPGHPPYSVPHFRLSTSRLRGEGRFLGRLMVNPYLQFIGALRDKWSGAPIPLASVKIRRVGGALAEPESALLQSSVPNGVIEWVPDVLTFGNLEVDIEVDAPGYPRPYRWRDTIAVQYLDEPQRLRPLFVGGGSYETEVRRRGTKEHFPGVTVEFVRTGGVRGIPQSFALTLDSSGRFDVPIDMPDSGTLIGDLTIHPPAPFPVEVVKNISLTRFDKGEARLLGPFGYGAAAIARPVLVYRATGKPVQRGTHARFTHVGGIQDIVPLKWNVPVDSGIRVVDSTGTVGYDAVTPDTGVVLYDIEVRLNEPHDWETIRGKSVPARYSDVDAIDTIRVGSWLPWQGELRDAQTNAPVAGAKVTFVWTAGAPVRPLLFTSQSDAAGVFLIRPEPLGRGAVSAALIVRGGSTYRDTTVAVKLFPAQSDVSLPIGVIRLTRLVP